MLSSSEDCGPLTKEQEIELAWEQFHTRSKVKSPSLADLRNQRVEEQNNKCHYCSIEMTVREGEFRRATDATLDHKLPKCFGGPDTLENLVASCSGCNNHKGNMDYTAYMRHIGRKQWHTFTHSAWQVAPPQCSPSTPRVSASYLESALRPHGSIPAN